MPSHQHLQRTRRRPLQRCRSPAAPTNQPARQAAARVWVRAHRHRWRERSPCLRPTISRLVRASGRRHSRNCREWRKRRRVHRQRSRSMIAKLHRATLAKSPFSASVHQPRKLMSKSATRYGSGPAGPHSLRKQRTPAPRCRRAARRRSSIARNSMTHLPGTCGTPPLHATSRCPVRESLRNETVVSLPQNAKGPR